MNELRVEIGGSTRGFQMATEETKVLARKLERDLANYKYVPPKLEVKEREFPVGALRSMQHILTDIMRLDFERLPFAFAHLAHQLGLTEGAGKAATSAARTLANAYAELAAKQAAIAAAAALKADQSATAMVAENGEGEATLQSALADEQKAVAARAAAVATAKKAENARIAAAAEEAEAGATETAAAAGLGALGLIAGAVAAIVVVFGVWWGKTKMLTEALTGLKLPDFEPEYIAKHLQRVNQMAEGWKQISQEVRKTVDAYNSAGAAAERIAAATKEHFEHLRRMNDLSNAPEAEKEKNRLAIDQAERSQEIANKQKAAQDLYAEGNQKKAQADAIEVSSKESDENILRKRKADAEAAQKYLKDLQDPKFSAKAGDFFATGLGTNGASKAAIEEAKQDGKKAAFEYIRAYHEWVDKVADNDELRRQKKELTDTAGRSLSESVKLQLEIPESQKLAAQKNQDEAAELAAKQAQKKQDYRSDSAGRVHVDSLSGAGLFTSAGATVQPLLDIGQRQLMTLQTIARNTQVRAKDAYAS